MSHNFQELVDDWKQRINFNQKAHYLIADRFNKYHYWIGLPATILATIAGATLLAEADEPWIRISVGVIGLIAAILSAVQTFYSHAKRAESHRAAAAQLGQVRRDIEILEQFTPKNKADQVRVIQQINERISKIDETAPVIDTLTMVGMVDEIESTKAGSVDIATARKLVVLSPRPDMDE